MKKGLFVLASLLIMSSHVCGLLNIEGNTVWFNDIGQDPGNYYGAASVVGDSILFNPTNFAAGTGEAQMYLNKQVWFTIDAKAGRDIDSLEIEEYGDWTLQGVGTAATFVEVSAIGNLRIEQVEGVDLANPITVQGTMLFKQGPSVWTDGRYELPTDGPGSSPWEGELKFDIDQILLDNSVVGKATRVYFTMDNILTAITEDGTIAQIEKKDIGGFVVTVPEPATLVLLGLGGLLLRRKK